VFRLDWNNIELGKTEVFPLYQQEMLQKNQHRVKNPVETESF